jgi:hypothetical protein
MEALASEYPDLNLPQNYMQAGTSTYQPPTLKSEQPFYAAVFGEPVVSLQVFSLSGLSLLGLTAVPPVKRHKQLKQALVLGVVVLVVFSIGYFVGLTAAQTWTTAIEPGSLVETASYVIWTDGTYVYAKNGQTGAIDFKGTDASTVIQAAIDALTDGGRIFIKVGTYDFQSTLKPKSFVAIIGEDMHKTILRPASASVTPLISYEQYKDTSSTQECNVLESLSIDMRGYTNAVAIDIYNLKVSRFENLRLTDYTIGFRLQGYDSTGYSFWNLFRNILSQNPSSLDTRKLFYIANNRAIDCWIDTVYGDAKGGYGFETDGAGVWYINNFWLTRAKTLIYLKATSSIGSIFINRPVIDTVTDHGIVFENTATGNIFQAEITEPHFISPPANKDLFYFQGYSGKTFSGIKIIDAYTSSTTHRYIANFDGVGTFGNSNRIIRSNCPRGTSGYYNNIPVSCIKEDRYYITENSGTFSSVSNGTYITHGLAGTPTTVTITLSVRGYAWLGTTNSTHFQIYASVATISGSWYAEYKP